MHCLKYIVLLLSLISTDAYRVTRLPTPRYTVSEVPHWDAKSQSLYYIDIAGYNSTVNRFDYAENRVYQAKIDNAPEILFILPIKCRKNHFLVGIANAAEIVIWDGKSPKATVVETLFKLDAGTSNIINDVKTDACGRFYGGTKSVEECNLDEPGTGGFYRYRRGRGVEKFLGHLYISNGLTWVRKTKKFYLIDSCAYDVKEFDYDLKTGEITNGHSIYSTIQNMRKPDYILDGMTNDVDGNLYFATFGGSKIIKFSPKTRQVLMEIHMPAAQITSLAFGGPKMNILFVTTANKDGKQPESSGYVYKVTGLCATGYPGVKFNMSR